jgi:hypothetical protein
MERWIAKVARREFVDPDKEEVQSAPAPEQRHKSFPDFLSTFSRSPAPAIYEKL